VSGVTKNTPLTSVAAQKANKHFCCTSITPSKFKVAVLIFSSAYAAGRVRVARLAPEVTT